MVNTILAISCVSQKSVLFLIVKTRLRSIVYTSNNMVNTILAISCVSQKSVLFSHRKNRITFYCSEYSAARILLEEFYFYYDVARVSDTFKKIWANPIRTVSARTIAVDCKEIGL